MDLPWPLPASIQSHSGPELRTLPTFDASGKCVLLNSATGLSSKDLPWPLPVREYERSYAAVLSSKPAVDHSGNYIYYTYLVRFDVIDVGCDPMQQWASDFVLLTPRVLDSEVAQMSIKLQLPQYACVKAKISECQKVALHADQVELTKQFNTWLFGVVLGKQAVPAGAGPNCIDSPKEYYVLPLKVSKSRQVEFDWPVVRASLASGLIYRKKVKYFGGFAKLETEKIYCDSAALSPGHLVMRNGTFSEEDLDDGIITCAHNGMPCYVTSISKHLNGSSPFPSIDSLGCWTYADYYAKKCEYRLKYNDQPFLKGSRLLRTSNYFKPQETDETKGKDVLRRSESLELPPEICSLHMGIKGRLFRGAMRLPSLLHNLEMALLAAELRDHIGVPISCFKVLVALTSRACQGDTSYEALELLGDSILKFTGCTYLFLKDFLQTQDQLGATLYELVRNKTLYYCALTRSLARYAFVVPFAPRLWIPPGLLPGKVADYHLVSCRTLADIVEALLGAYLMEGGLDLALKAMVWLCVPIKFPSSIPNTFQSTLSGTESCVAELCSLFDVNNLEIKIGYIFKDKKLLAAALKYESQISQCSPFQRLAFLGDGIFDYVITRHLIRAYPEEDEGKLSELKQAIRNNENLACLAVLRGLHVYLQQATPSLEQPIALYISSFMKEGVKAFGFSSVCAPKGLGDLLQTLAAAIYIDSDLDVEIVWQVLRPLLEPLPTPLTVTVHPIKQLETLCVEKGWSLKILVNCLEKYVQAEVWINELVMGNSKNEDKKVARRLAATMALRGISNQNSAQPKVF